MQEYYIHIDCVNMQVYYVSMEVYYIDQVSMQGYYIDQVTMYVVVLCWSLQVY